eukprot:136463-Amphidinium_carterae.2
MEEKLQPQKAATPVDGIFPIQDAEIIFATQRPKSVVAEGENAEQRDADGVIASALHDLGQSLHGAEENLEEKASESQVIGSPSKRRRFSVRTMEIRTGNEMVDQFKSAYFGVAFAFLFKYGTIPTFRTRCK